MNLKVKTLHELLTLATWLDQRRFEYPELYHEVNEEIALRLKGDTYQLNIEENDNTTIGVSRSEE